MVLVYNSSMYIAVCTLARLQGSGMRMKNEEQNKANTLILFNFAILVGWVPPIPIPIPIHTVFFVFPLRTIISSQ